MCQLWLFKKLHKVYMPRFPHLQSGESSVFGVRVGSDKARTAVRRRVSTFFAIKLKFVTTCQCRNMNLYQQTSKEQKENNSLRVKGLEGIFKKIKSKCWQAEMWRERLLQAFGGNGIVQPLWRTGSCRASPAAHCWYTPKGNEISMSMSQQNAHIY